MLQSAEFRSQIKADKFFPPQVDTPKFFYRQRVLDSLLSQNKIGLPTLLIEAQAGQGKTTVIKQFINRLRTTSVWYQVGPEDGDPAFFLQAILACFSSCLSDFPSNNVATVMAGSDFSIFDLENRINLLLNDLLSKLKNDMYIVFDDLHYLNGHHASLFVLNHLLETSPPKLHFILASREALPLYNRQAISRSHDLLRLGNRGLALNEGEVTDFFQQVLQLDVPHSTIQKITSITDGWIMGVLLLGLQSQRQRDSSGFVVLTTKGETDNREVFQYFRREILSTLERRLYRPLQILALLEEIPVDLASELTGEAGIGADLADLARHNLFIRPLDAVNTTFGLHHLFRQFLHERAKAAFSKEQIRDFYRRAGQFALRQANPAQALRYLLLGEDYAAVEAVLEGHGMSFLALNRTATLAAILARIPKHILARQGWSLFYLALANMDLAPIKALPLLDQAMAVFAARQDRVGELLSLAHIISIHIITTGDYREGEERLIRATQVFDKTTEVLPPAMRILIGRSLAMGYGIFQGDMAEATRFASQALELARKEKLVNFEAALLMVMGYIQIFAGQYARARMYIEEATPFLHRPEVGIFNGLSIRLMQIDYLMHDSDYVNYFDQKNRFIDTVGITLFSQSTAGPFSFVMEMDIALNRGRLEEALVIAEQALKHQPPLSPHLLSQILQNKALALALRRQSEEALAVAEESQRLRQQSGGLYYIVVNRLVVGLTRCYCGHPQEALTLITEGIRAARQMPNDYLVAGGFLHRAAVFLEAGAEREAESDIERGLGLMRHNAYRHLWAWPHQTMLTVLGFAVSHDIETKYARTLATECLGLALGDDGSAVPLLEFKTLGRFEIRHHATTLLRAEYLTPLQRELLSLLLAAPGFKLPQETIQFHFWPDSPPDTVKVKFDTMISRLRKTLTDALSENTVHLYLRRGKGMIWLAHCRLDAHLFLDTVRRGLNHCRAHEYWQAGNAFTLAESLWQGEFAPGVAGEELVRTFREELVRTLSELVISWSDLLVESNRLPQAIRVVEKALHDDPLNDQLYGLLYRLQGKKSAILARLVLKRFTSVLEREGYPGDEIAELLAQIVANRSS